MSQLRKKTGATQTLSSSNLSKPFDISAAKTVALPSLKTTKNNSDKLSEDTEDEETVMATSSPSMRATGSKKNAPAHIWHLQYRDGRSGPFSVNEVEAILKFHKLAPPVYCWRPGMKEWATVDQVEEFKPRKESIKTGTAESNKSKSTGSSSSSQRKYKRGALLATIKIFLNENTLVGICRNISVSGIHILGCTPPGEVGSECKIQVVPSGGFSISPFEVTAKVIRISTDRPGFAAEFLDLPLGTYEALKKHLG